MTLNKILLMGRVGIDPVMRHTRNGTPVTNFRLAVSNNRRDANGELVEDVEWFNVTAWERQAESVNQYLSKGQRVYVEGRLSTSHYTSSSGETRTALEVRASDVRFLDPPDSSSEDRKFILIMTDLAEQGAEEGWSLTEEQAALVAERADEEKRLALQAEALASRLLLLTARRKEAERRLAFIMTDLPEQGLEEGWSLTEEQVALVAEREEEERRLAFIMTDLAKRGVEEGWSLTEEQAALVAEREEKQWRLALQAEAEEEAEAKAEAEREEEEWRLALQAEAEEEAEEDSRLLDLRVDYALEKGHWSEYSKERESPEIDRSIYDLSPEGLGPDEVDWSSEDRAP
jgi:single-strand DNA-binding protein